MTMSQESRSVEHNEEALNAIESTNADLERRVKESGAPVRVEVRLEMDARFATTVFTLVDDKQPSCDGRLDNAVTVFTQGVTGKVNVMPCSNDMIDRFLDRANHKNDRAFRVGLA
jgi:hypothetical protein